MPSPLSFDQSPDRFRDEVASLADRPFLEIQELLKEYPELIDRFSRYLRHLWGYDLEVCRLYYLYGMTQHQVATLLDTTQQAIHSRLQSIRVRLQFGIERDELGDILTIRDELEALMPPDLTLTAFLYCFEIQQDRVSKLMQVSPATAHRQLKKILEFLKQTSVGYNDKHHLARKYLPFFAMIKGRDRGAEDGRGGRAPPRCGGKRTPKSNIMTAIVKANDCKRKGALVRGPSVFEDGLGEEDPA